MIVFNDVVFLSNFKKGHMNLIRDVIHVILHDEIVLTVSIATVLIWFLILTVLYFVYLA